MFFPPPAADGVGRTRTQKSLHQRDDGISGIQDAHDGSQQDVNIQEGNSLPSAKGSSANVGTRVGNRRMAGSVKRVFAAPSGGAAAGSFCPAIIAPTQAPSALAAAAAFGKNGGVAAVADCKANDSFLGFGLDVPPQELWGEPVTSGDGRGRAPSSDGVVDLGAGCDLGWGDTVDEDENPVSRGRGRGEEDDEEGGEQEPSFDYYAEGRPSSVPDIDPHWTFGGDIGGQTRSARARSSSFYEGDDAKVMACINGETPNLQTSRRSASMAEMDNLNQSDSLAHRHGGDSSMFSEFEKLLAPRDTDCRSTALQAAVVQGIEGIETPGGVNPVTVTAAGRRRLGQRELLALQAGLRMPIPGGRKYSSGDDQNSDSDPNSEDEEGEEPYYSRENERDEYPQQRMREAFCPTEEERLSAVEGGYRDGGGLTQGVELPGPLDYRSRLGVEEMPPPQRNTNVGGDDSGGVFATSSSASLQALVGGHVLPPGVDPFLSGAGSDGSGARLPLSPRAVMMSGAATDTAMAAAAAAFPFAAPLPLPLPVHVSPPRPRAAPVVDGSSVAELGPEGIDIPEARHSPIVLWPPADNESSAAAMAVPESRTLTCTANDSSPESVCSPPLPLASPSPGDAFPSPRSQTPLDVEMTGVPSLVASPPAPPPSQLAPLPPPPEPLAPSPPRPRTPDSLSLEAPFPADTNCSRGESESSDIVSSLPYGSSCIGRGGGSPRCGNGSSSGGGGGGGRGQMNRLMPPPPPPSATTQCSRGGALYGSGSNGAGWTGPAGPGASVFGSGGSIGGGGGVSRLMGPGGPFGSNRSGAGSGMVGHGPGVASGYPGARARYRSGGGGGNGRSTLFGSAPGTLGDSSTQREHGLRGSSTVQGFLSVGGGTRNRRGHGGAQQSKKIKLLMLGDSGVGKSSLMDRFTEGYFNLTTIQTLGVDFKLKTIVINDEEVDLQVWDTAGQQKFHKITQAYYRGSHGIVVVYDVSDPKTLDNTAYWMQSIRDASGSNRMQICLVGNKVDLRQDASRNGKESGASMVETYDGRMIAEEFGAEYFECSAKTGLMVEEAFVTTATKAYEAHLVKPGTPSSRSRRRVGRKKLYRNASMGSDKDRPPRGDASWPTAAATPTFVLGSEGGVERLDSARIRHSAPDICETSSGSVASQTPSAYSHFPGAIRAGLQRHTSSTSTSSGGSPSPTVGRPMMTTTPPRGTRSLPQQQQQQQPSPPSAVRREEQQQQPQQQPVRDLVPTLSALSPKSAAAALDMGARKGAVTEAAGEDSPTGTGTMSPPAHQRSIGRSSSLGDMESYFGTALTSPKSSDNDSNAADGVTRRRADTGGLLGLFGGDGKQVVDGHNSSSSGTAYDEGSRSDPQIEAEVKRQRHKSSPNPTTATDLEPGGNDVPVTGGSRVKGKKPPRVPRIKRVSSGDAVDVLRGKGGKNSCKIS